MTVWRELRRLKTTDTDPELLKKAIAAADDGNWMAYVEIMGGAVLPRNERPIRPMMIVREQCNEYGELIACIKGLFMDGCLAITRTYDWVIGLAKDEATNVAECRAPPLAVA